MDATSMQQWPLGPYAQWLAPNGKPVESSKHMQTIQPILKCTSTTATQGYARTGPSPW